MTSIKPFNYNDAAFTDALANVTDCDDATCMQLMTQEVKNSLVLPFITDPFTVLPVIIMGHNLRVEQARHACSDIPLIVMMHNSSTGNVGQGLYDLNH